MARMILPLLVVCAFLVGTPLAAASPQPDPSPTGCPEPALEAAAEGARAVFTGEVVGARRLDDLNGRPQFSHQVNVDLVYTGRVTNDTITVRTLGRGRCALGQLDTGTPYLFFASAGDPRWVARNGGGTAPADPQLLADVEALLGEGAPPAKPVPETAEFTTVDDSEPAEFTRLAAPGAALVLIGLLGMALFGLLGRRR